MNTSEQFLDSIDTAIVVISRSDGLVKACKGELVDVVSDSLIGSDWQTALGVSTDSAPVIQESLKSGVAAILPPTLIGWGAESEMVVSGMMAPQQYQGAESIVLFLRRLTGPGDLSATSSISSGDIIAILGVDYLEYGPAWGVLETNRLMIDLRQGLQQILRDIDYLSLPSGATITVVFRGLQPGEAVDFSRALLSHLHQRLAAWGEGASDARVCIGLAQRLKQQSPLDALLRANQALLKAQLVNDLERIHFSSLSDVFTQTAHAIGAAGVFVDQGAIGASDAYLRAVVALSLNQAPPDRAMWEVVALTLVHSGASTVALVRCETGGKNVFVCAGELTTRGPAEVNCAKLPKRLQGILNKINSENLARRSPIEFQEGAVRVLPLVAGDVAIGALVLLADQISSHPFDPGASALQYLGAVFGEERYWGGQRAQLGARKADSGRQMEKGIEGYVVDNMEGAIDQAVFLAGVDIPIAVIGARGTGKMYVAQVVQREYSGESGKLVRIECHTFRSRADAQNSISSELSKGEGKTLVFKSPHLLHLETQVKLAKQLSSRKISDASGTRYLPRMKFIGLFPEHLDVLVRRGELDERLASVFAGYPIEVPPLRLRGRAVLRWAHKVLEQEGARRDRRILGFTPDAEQAMLHHHWPGNISEMREVISAALDITDKEWVTPVDLGIFLGISADGASTPARDKPLLKKRNERPVVGDSYLPTPLEALRVALGQALATCLATENHRPLGVWLDDEIIFAASERFDHNDRHTAGLLGTRARNVGRWLPGLMSREPERSASLLWQEARQCVQRWIRETDDFEEPPQEMAQSLLLSLVTAQCEGVPVAERAAIMGISTPTYQKRLSRLQGN